MELSPEAYKLKEELAVLGVAVTSLRAQKAELEATLERDVGKRLAEIEKATADALASSKRTVGECVALASEAGRWSDEVAAASAEVVAWAEEAASVVASELDALDAAKSALDARASEVSRVEAEAKIALERARQERSLAAAERNRNERDRADVESRRSALRAAFAEAKSKGVLK